MMRQQPLPCEGMAAPRLEPAQKPGQSRQNYGTPRVFIDAVVERFGPLVCDLAADATNAKAPEWYSETENALDPASDWAGDYFEGNLWLNPPFGDIAPWAEKCAAQARERHGFILMLTPASVGSNWFAQHVHGRAVVLGLSPRLTFEGCTDAYPKDLMLSVFGYGLAGFDTWRWRP